MTTDHYVIDSNLARVLQCLKDAPEAGLTTAQLSALTGFTQRQVLKSLNTLRAQLPKHFVATECDSRRNVKRYRALPGAVQQRTQLARKPRHVCPTLSDDEKRRGVLRILSTGGRFDDGCTLSLTALCERMDQIPAQLLPTLTDLVNAGLLGTKNRGGGLVYFKLQENSSAPGVAQPRCYDMMRAPPLQAIAWAPARADAEQHKQYKSRGV